MRLLRVSILGLMGFVLVASLGLAALRFSTSNVAAVVVLLTLLLCGLAVLAIIYRRGSRRAFWVGFALFGWGYLSFSAGSWTLSEQSGEYLGMGRWLGTGYRPFSPPRSPVLTHWFGITTFLDSIRPSVQASIGAGIPSNGVASLLDFGNARTRAVTAALDLPIRMPFVNETPLKDVIAHIKANTQSPELPEGIPIYVDPIGLQESEKTMASPISIDMNGIPLRTSLSLILRQLDLRYTLDDGLLTISGRSYTPEDVAARVESFRRVGHSLFALAFATMGGFAARALHATRDRSSDASM
jgi:hypothetical protein